eukprot:gene3023-biopygen6552
MVPVPTTVESAGSTSARCSGWTESSRAQSRPCLECLVGWGHSDLSRVLSLQSSELPGSAAFSEALEFPGAPAVEHLARLDGVGQVRREVDELLEGALPLLAQLRGEGPERVHRRVGDEGEVRPAQGLDIST